MKRSTGWTVLVAAATAAACASERDVAGTVDLDAADLDASSDGPVWGGDGPLPAGLGCSGDLHSIVDATGNLIATCPPDEGCAGGRCIPACDAAAVSRGSVGCDFLVAQPVAPNVPGSGCYAVFVANNWPRAVQIRASLAGQALDVLKFGRIATSSPDWTAWPPIDASGVAPDHVAVLFLADSGASDCRVPVARTNNTVFLNFQPLPIGGPGIHDAVHLALDTPANVYDMMPFGGAATFYPGASLIYPISAWGTNIVAATPPLDGSPGFGGVSGWGQLVAAANDTHVQILPTVDLPAAGSVPATPKNTMTAFTLQAGQFSQWVNLSMDQAHWMSGSVIASDKPVSFVAGDFHCSVSADTNGNGACDVTHTPTPPVNAWGSEYVATPYATRRIDLLDESVPWRVVVAVNGTTLTYDPPVAGAPTGGDRGATLDFEARAAFTVKSQDKDHPFYLGVTMPQASLTVGSRPGVDLKVHPFELALGDPEHVNVLPPPQFLPSYTFFTDPTFATTNFVVTRVRTAAGTFEDVTIDCLGTIGGWQTVDAAGQYQTTNVDIIRGFIPVGSCMNGPHKAASKAPFGLTVWGLDYAASYGYPAGGNAATINSVVVPPVPN